MKKFKDFTVSFISFMHKCRCLSINPITVINELVYSFSFFKFCIHFLTHKALDGHYFTSLPFKRSGSFTFFNSLKEDSLEAVSAMLKEDPELMYEKDHVNK